MSINRNLERDIDNAKNGIESVIDQLMDIIADLESENDDFQNQIVYLENKIEELREELDYEKRNKHQI